MMTCEQAEKKILTASAANSDTEMVDRDLDAHLRSCPQCMKKYQTLLHLDHVLADDTSDVPMPDDSFFAMLHDTTIEKIAERKQTEKQPAAKRRGFFAAVAAVWKPALGMASVIILSFVVWEVFQEQTAMLTVADIPSAGQMKRQPRLSGPEAEDEEKHTAQAQPDAPIRVKEKDLPSLSSGAAAKQSMAEAAQKSVKNRAGSAEVRAGGGVAPSPSVPPAERMQTRLSESALLSDAATSHGFAAGSPRRPKPLALDEAPLAETELKKRRSISGMLSSLQQKSDSENHSYAETMRKHNELLNVDAQIALWQDYLKTTPDTSAFYPHAVLHLARLYLSAAQKKDTPAARLRARSWLEDHDETLKPLMGTRDFEQTLHSLQTTPADSSTSND